MIDLRSDTVTLPGSEMLQTILTAKLGDDGRRTAEGSGGDETVNELERLAASILNKEDAVLFPTGTMANTAALLSTCAPGGSLLVDESIHMYAAEKVAFDKRFGQLNAVFYRLTDEGLPDTEDLREKLAQSSPRLVCIENTHNYAGGSCMPPALIKEISDMAHKKGVEVHMDGARLFNAACALGVDASQLAEPVDTVMFCLSKGLGAPMGSLLCGKREHMKTCRDLRKLLGGSMRQAGVMAAPGIWALKHNITRIAEDHNNARLFAQILAEKTDRVRIGMPVSSNIVLLDINDTGLSPEEFLAGIAARGVEAHRVPGYVRVVFHLNVSRSDTVLAAGIVADFVNEEK